MRQHGTHTKYVNDRCRCTPCRVAAATYERHRVARHATGETFFVDATPTRQHLHKLLKAGIGQDRIETVANIGHTAQWLIRTGKRLRVLPSTEKAILTLDPDDRTLLADGAYVDSAATMRNVQSLMVEFGWTKTRIAQDILGTRTPALQVGKNGQVTKRTADLIDAALTAERTVAAKGCGVLTCRVCGRPYADHRLTEVCRDVRYSRVATVGRLTT